MQRAQKPRGLIEEHGASRPRVDEAMNRGKEEVESYSPVAQVGEVDEHVLHVVDLVVHCPPSDDEEYGHESIEREGSSNAPEDEGREEPGGFEGMEMVLRRVRAHKAHERAHRG